MKKNRIKTKRAICSSTISSVIGTSTALCCAGPGLAGCAVACASGCGSLGLSIFGLSATGLAHWVNHYWYIFLIISVLFFSEAAYRIFYINKSKDQKRAKLLFFLSVFFSILLFGRLFFSC